MSHFYLKSIRNTIIQFLDIFNNISIAKYAKNGNILKYVTCPVKMASKEKSYYWLRDQKHEKALPMIAVQLLSINYDAQRVTGKNQPIEFNIDTTAGSYSWYHNPVPYNMDFQVSIIANYIIEIDQILEQILSFFNPFVFIRTSVSDYSDETFDLKVIFTGANPEHGPQLEESEYRWLVWNLNFTIQAYLFKPVIDSNAAEGEGLVKSIVRRYWMDEDIMDAVIDTDFTNIPTSATGYTMSSVTSALGYDEDACLLYSYEIYDREDE